MQLELLFRNQRSADEPQETLFIRGRWIRLSIVRNRRARRYVLRLSSNGVARVTIPRGGSVFEGRRFLQRNISWIERQLLRQEAQPVPSETWAKGTEILFRGEPVRLRVETKEGQSRVWLGAEGFRLQNANGDLRPEIETILWQVASTELALRVGELAVLHKRTVGRILVRNQRSRWGSCSRRGTISLNWRLVQTPAFVRDYIILHEMAHLKEMNHSVRFWREVERLCPEFEVAERWLKGNSRKVM